MNMWMGRFPFQRQTGHLRGRTSPCHSRSSRGGFLRRSAAGRCNCERASDEPRQLYQRQVWKGENMWKSSWHGNLHRRSLTYLWWCSLLKRIILPGSCIDLSEVQSNQARISEYLRQKWRRTSNFTGHWIYWALWCFLMLSAPLLPGGIWSSDIRTPWHSLGLPTTAPPWSSRGHRSQSDPRGWPNVEQCTMVFHGFPINVYYCLRKST